MTNELEKQFFQCFGIEPHYYCANEYVFEAMLEYECTEGNREKCKTCKKVGKSYPQITDHILLELICIVAKYYCFRWDNWIDEYSSVDKLKNFILLELIGLVYQEGIKHQVRTLFEEER